MLSVLFWFLPKYFNLILFFIMSYYKLSGFYLSQFPRPESWRTRFWLIQGLVRASFLIKFPCHCGRILTEDKRQLFWTDTHVHIFYFILCIGVLSEYMSMHHVSVWYQWRSNNGVRSNESRAKDGCLLGMEPGVLEEHQPVNHFNYLANPSRLSIKMG